MREELKTNCIVIVYDNGRHALRPLHIVTREVTDHIKSFVQPIIRGHPQRLMHLCIHVRLTRSYVAVHGMR